MAVSHYEPITLLYISFRTNLESRKLGLNLNNDVIRKMSYSE